MARIDMNNRKKMDFKKIRETKLKAKRSAQKAKKSGKSEKTVPKKAVRQNPVKEARRLKRKLKKEGVELMAESTEFSNQDSVQAMAVIQTGGTVIGGTQPTADSTTAMQL